MQATTIIILVCGMLIFSLIVVLAVQSKKKPGKDSKGKKSSNRDSAAATQLTQDPIISQISSTSDIPYIKPNPTGRQVVVKVAGENNYENLLNLMTPEQRREIEEYEEMTARCSDWANECTDDPNSSACIEFENNCNVVPHRLVHESGTNQDRAEVLTRSLTPIVDEDTPPVRRSRDTQSIQFDDLPTSGYVDGRSYIPNIDYLKNMYEEESEFILVDPKNPLNEYIEIDLDNMGREYIPHHVQSKYEDTYTLTYSLWPIEGQRSNYRHHHPGYANYYMMVEMTLIGDHDDIDEVISNNYIIDPQGRSIYSKNYTIEGDEITLVYYIQRVDDYIPIHINVATFNNVEDRYLIPMVDNISIQESPYDYTDRIVLVKDGLTQEVESDVINGVYVIRIP